MFTKKRFRQDLVYGCFLEWFGSVKAYTIFVIMVVIDAKACKICCGIVANGAKPYIICW